MCAVAISLTSRNKSPAIVRYQLINRHFRGAQPDADRARGNLAGPGKVRAAIVRRQALSSSQSVKRGATKSSTCAIRRSASAISRLISATASGIVPIITAAPYAVYLG